MPTVLHRLGVLVIAILALALTAQAQALELLSTSDQPEVARFQSWVDASRMPTPPVSLYVVLQSCPVAVSDGCIVHEPQATVYLGSFVQDRAAFQAIFADSRAWRSPPNSPHERFAEAYSLCARHPAIRRTYTGAYAYRVTPAQQRRVCGLIRRAAA